MAQSIMSSFPEESRRVPPTYDSEPPAEVREITVDPVGLAAMLEAASGLLDVPIESDKVLDIATRVAADATGIEPGLRAAAAAGLELGLLPIVQRPTVAELVELCGEGACIAVPMPGERQQRWMVLSGHTTAAKITVYEIDGGQVRKRRRRRAALRQRLEASGAMMTTALRFEPRYPLQAIKGGGGGSGAHDPKEAMRKLWRLVRLEGQDLWMVLVYALFIGVLTLVTPVAVQALVNTIAFGSVLQPLIILTIALLAGLAFGAVLQALRLYVVEVLQRRVFVRVATDFGRRIPRLSREVHDTQHVPELANRFFDVITVQKAGSALAIDALGLLLQTVMGLCLLAFYHPLLLAFDVLLVVILVFVVLLPAQRGVQTAIEESKAKYATAAWLEAIAASPRLFRGADPADAAAARTDALCRRYIASRSNHWRKLLSQIVGGLGLQVVASVALLGVGGWLVIERQLTLGQLVAAELVVALIGAGFAKLGKQLEKLYDAVAAMDKIGAVVDAERERDGGLQVEGRGAVHLVLEGVTRQAAGPALPSVVTTTVEPGDRVALRGPSGSGKSTLLEIAAGIRTPSSGKVRVDDVDLRQADLMLYRQDVCLVTDEPLPFTTIAEYLRLARPEASTEVLRRALRHVGLNTKVAELSAGLDTRLLPNGSPFSRSEVRRLHVARALVHRPRLLLLDDALSGLGLDDAAFEELLARLLGPEAPWTAIVVSDDERILRRCNASIDLSTTLPTRGDHA